MDQISTIIDEENLTSVIDIIENQINESDYTAMDIAAAFLYQAMGASEISTAESKDDYDSTIQEQRMAWYACLSTSERRTR